METGQKRGEVYVGVANLVGTGVAWEGADIFLKDVL